MENERKVLVFFVSYQHFGLPLFFIAYVLITIANRETPHGISLKFWKENYIWNGSVSLTKTALFILPLVVGDLPKCDHFGLESWGLTKAERTNGGPSTAAGGATRAERPGAGANVEPLTERRRALQELCDVCRLLPSVPGKERWTIFMICTLV